MRLAPFAPDVSDEFDAEGEDTMIDELVLERLFAETAEEIPLPELGMTRVIDELERSLQRPPRTVPLSSIRGCRGPRCSSWSSGSARC